MAEMTEQEWLQHLKKEFKSMELEFNKSMELEFNKIFDRAIENFRKTSPNPKCSANKVFSSSDLVSPIKLNLPELEGDEPEHESETRSLVKEIKPTDSKITTYLVKSQEATIEATFEAKNTKTWPKTDPNKNSKPTLSYPNPIFPPIQTQSIHAVNQSRTAFLDANRPEPWPNKPSINTNPNRPNPWPNKQPTLTYFIRPKPWPGDHPICTVPKSRTGSNETMKLGKQTRRRSYQFQHRSVSLSSRAAADIEANKPLLASHHISRTTATPYTTLPSPSEILGLSISSSRRCPSVQVSHLFDPFETGEFAFGLADGRPCSGTDPTPEPRHGSAPERVGRELTPSPDLKWAWSATKVHRFVDFRNEVANWKDYGEEMEFSEKDLVKKKNDLELSKKKKNSVLVCLKKKKIWDLWAIEDLGDWFIEEDEQLGISKLGFQKNWGFLGEISKKIWDFDSRDFGLGVVERKGISRLGLKEKYGDFGKFWSSYGQQKRKETRFLKC